MPQIKLPHLWSWSLGFKVTFGSSPAFRYSSRQDFFVLLLVTPLTFQMSFFGEIPVLSPITRKPGPNPHDLASLASGGMVVPEAQLGGNGDLIFRVGKTKEPQQERLSWASHAKTLKP